MCSFKGFALTPCLFLKATEVACQGKIVVFSPVNMHAYHCACVLLIKCVPSSAIFSKVKDVVGEFLECSVSLVMYSLLDYHYNQKEKSEGKTCGNLRNK